MASRYGATRGEPEYDRFRTGLTFDQVRLMARTSAAEPDARKRHSRRRRRGILGAWGQYKREMWHRMCEATGRRTSIPPP